MNKIDEMPLKKSKQLWGPLGIRVRIASLIVFISLGAFLIGWGLQYHERHESISSHIENNHITNKTPAVFQGFSLVLRAKTSLGPKEEELVKSVHRSAEVEIKLIVPNYMQWFFQLMRSN